MNLWRMARTYRSLMRLRTIVTVLARRGFSELLERLQLQSHVPLVGRLWRSISGEAEGLSTAERARLALQELGPTFVKFGQVLSARPDLIPDDFAEEFTRLQDDVGPFPAEEARAIIETELGRPIDRLFSRFESEPAASGSIAQIHFAELAGGEKVVVKVRRPGIEATVAADLDILAGLAELAEKHVPEARVYRPVMLVEEFRRNLERELDFVAEASSVRRIGEAFKDDPRIRIPRVHWEETTSAVLTLERMTGTPLSNIEAVKASCPDLRALSRTIADCFMKQFFEVGLFHADPHPGNIFVGPEGTVALLDFGSVGNLTRDTKRQLATTLIALEDGDLDLIIDVHSEAGVFDPETDPQALRADLGDLVNRYYGVPASRLDVGRVFSDVVALARKHRAALPREFVMLGRSLVLVAGLCQRLDATFDLSEIIPPHVKKLLVSGLSPTGMLRRVGVELYHLAGLARRLPRELAGLLRKARSGELELRLRHEGAESLARELEIASNRISFSVVTGAIVVASSLLLHAQVRPHVSWLAGLVGLGPLGEQWENLSVFGLAGFLIAFFLGLKLLWDIARSGKLGR